MAVSLRRAFFKHIKIDGICCLSTELHCGLIAFRQNYIVVCQQGHVPTLDHISAWGQRGNKPIPGPKRAWFIDALLHHTASINKLTKIQHTILIRCRQLVVDSNTPHTLFVNPVFVFHEVKVTSAQQLHVCIIEKKRIYMAKIRPQK